MITRQYMQDHPEVDWSVFKKQQTTPIKTREIDESEDNSSNNVNMENKDNSPSGFLHGLSQVSGQLKNAAAHPIDTLQDVGAGFMGGAQRLTATIGQGVEYPTHAAYEAITGNKVPHYNVREAMGLEGNNKVDLKDYLASKNNNELAKSIGQYAFGALGGGTNLVRQIGSNAAWSGIQGEPGERLKDAFVGGATAAIPLGISKGTNAVKGAYQYVHPQMAAEALMSHLGKGAKTAEENINELANSIKNSYENNVQDALKSKEKVINSAGNKLIDAKNSSYINKGNATHLYDSDLNDLHKAFIENPTFENADKLQSQLGDEIGYYQRMAARNNLAPADKQKLTALKKARDYLNRDQDNLLTAIDPKLKDQYAIFKDKWKQNVIPYKSSQTLRDIIKKGNQAGITKAQINKEFAFPDKNVSKISSDLGQEGKDRILFNQVQGSKEGDAFDLAKAILDAKRNKGYQSYLSDEVEKNAQNLSKRANASKYYETAKAGVLGSIVGLMAGQPLIGAGMGIALKHGVPFAKILSKYLNR